METKIRGLSFADRMDKLDFVRNQCRGIRGARYHDNYTMICCPFHSDENPSGRIFHSAETKNPGFFKCYGCGKTASWNELAPLIGCEPFESKPCTRYFCTDMLYSPESDGEAHSEVLEHRSLPQNKRWRSISTNLLRSIGCDLCRIKYRFGRYSDWFLYLPVIVDGETVGYTKGRMHKEAGKTSYINLRGAWVKTHGLFPFDYALSKMTNTHTVVLVEGQRDALRLLSNGIPALCIMGTQSFSEAKCRLLEIHGVRRAVIMLDGDDAGIQGTKKVYSLLKNFMDCKVIQLWKIKGSPYAQFKDEENPSAKAKEQGVELWDAMNCPQWIVDYIKQKYL